MKNRIARMLAGIDGNRLLNETGKLIQMELGQTFKDYHAAANYALKLLQDSGIPNASILEYPADGIATYQDKRMPMAWDASVGKLTIMNGSGLQPGFVAADYRKHPFHLVKGSVATPPGGKVVDIITESQLLAGRDGRNSLVMLDPLTRPVSKVFKHVLDLGCVGVISDYLVGRYENPDAIQWNTAMTEGSNWHVQSEDRDFISFVVSPRIGDQLRAAAVAGGAKARIECDGRRYAGILPAVTALIPGRRSEEVWVMGHLYEPLADDNSSGIAAGIETARQIMAKGIPEFSVRVIFAMEMYGFAAYAASRGSCLRQEVVGACNYDGMRCNKEDNFLIRSSGSGTPFFGNYLLKLMSEEFKSNYPGIECILQKFYPGMYADDQFLTDSTTGVATVWPIHGPRDRWHNSVQTVEYLDKETFVLSTAFNAAFVDAVANPDPAWLPQIMQAAKACLCQVLADINLKSVGSDAGRFKHIYRMLDNDLADLSRFIPETEVSSAREELKKEYEKLAVGLSDHQLQGKWRNYARGIVASRVETGLPYDLIKVPKQERMPLPELMIYGPMANVLANMDGKKDLAAIICEAEYECNEILSDSRIKKYISAVAYLAQYGYLQVKNSNILTEAAIIEALKNVGVREGDILLVHASASACGQVEGGPKTIIEAIRKAVGPDGTALFATFTRPYLYLSVPNCGWNYRPFDPANYHSIWTGLVPRVLMECYPEVKRSRNITHSWAGLGAQAEACVEKHDAYDPPASANSPMGEALRRGGKILHFGNSIASTTFLHYLEDHFDSPFLQPAFCAVKSDEPVSTKVLIEKHLPGHRDFYSSNPENCKFFKQAFDMGLEMNRTTLGMSDLKLMDLKQLYDIGCRIMEKDPLVLLCDDPECLFCSKYF